MSKLFYTKSILNRKIKGITLYFMLILLFLTFNSKIIHSLLTSMADEVLLLVSIFIITIFMISRLKKFKIQKIFLVLFIYIVYQFVNYKISPFNLNILFVLIQSFINIKVFLVSLAFIIIFKESTLNLKLIKHLLYLFISLFLFGFISNLLLQESWFYLLGDTIHIRYRYGFIRPIGWLGLPGNNAYFAVLTFTTMLLLYSKRIVFSSSFFIKKFFIFFIIDFLAAFILTVRKGMFMNLSFGLATVSTLRKKNKITFTIITLLVIIVFSYLLKDTPIFQDTINDITNMTNDDKENKYIRGLMIYKGFMLFIEFFPFGVGNATFGTVLSQYNTFDVYYYAGIEEWRFMNGELKGLYDSGLFSMFAENGFFGMLIIIIFIYHFFKFNKKRLDNYNYKIFSIITWYALLLSLTEPVWQNGMFTVIYVINLLFIYGKNNIYREHGKWQKYETNN